MADTETAAAPDTELENTAWDLSHLLGGGPERIDELLDEADRLAAAFAQAYRGKLAEIDGAGLAAAMDELAAIHDAIGRAGNYAQLDFATDTAEPTRGALMQKVSERATAMETQLLFFDLEWVELDDARADELLAADGLDKVRHYLRSARRYRPHVLTEPEEKVLTEKSLTGSSAWSRLFEELTSALRVQLDDVPEPVSLEVALSRLYSPSRDTRAAAQEAVTQALAGGLRTRAYIYNTLLHDKAVDDRLRRYPHWLASRNLANEATDESVAALIEAVRGRYELPRRWYRLKAKLLGIERLADYDRMAVVSQDDETVPWREAKELVLDSYRSFSPELGDIVQSFFDDHWIDAPVRPNKRPGAFCAYAVPSVHPYVLLNYTSRRQDVLTLAHELGHGVHAALARPRGIFEMATPLTLAETASVFGETIVFGRLLEQSPTPESRLALLSQSLEGSIATVFRQVAMNRFEDIVHNARRNEGELSVDRFSRLWRDSQEELLGDAVEITSNYESWWSYIPHFIHTPGYVYAYSYGQLLALSVYQRYEQEGPGFVPAYLELLSAGGSLAPEELGKIVGIDLRDPGFWDAGLALVERQLTAAEEAAAQLQ